MLRRTHLAIGIGVALHFINHVEHEFIFLLTILLATILPDIDSGFSALGKNWFAKPIQAVTSHRGVLHSYTFCISATIALVFLYPILALPFFLGYSFHLFADSFTPQGIKPFWPLKLESKGLIKTGGVIEDTVFWTIVIVDIFLVILLFV